MMTTRSLYTIVLSYSVPSNCIINQVLILFVVVVVMCMYMLQLFPSNACYFIRGTGGTYSCGCFPFYRYTKTGTKWDIKKILLLFVVRIIILIYYRLFMDGKMFFFLLLLRFVCNSQGLVTRKYLWLSNLMQLICLHNRSDVIFFFVMKKWKFFLSLINFMMLFLVIFNFRKI